jgi:hypothetical protein
MPFLAWICALILAAAAAIRKLAELCGILIESTNLQLQQGRLQASSQSWSRGFLSFDRWDFYCVSTQISWQAENATVCQIVMPSLALVLSDRSAIASQSVFLYHPYRRNAFVLMYMRDINAGAKMACEFVKRNVMSFSLIILPEVASVINQPGPLTHYLSAGGFIKV